MSQHIAVVTQDSYIAYPATLKFLSEHFGVTSEELAAWLWLGQEDGGITAYRNANELYHPTEVLFLKDEPQDLLSLLGSCWFKQSDLERFKPSHRFISGKALKKRWESKLEIPVECFIQAKIEESRLLDFPILTNSSSKLALGDFDNTLFLVDHIEAIELEDMSINDFLSSVIEDSSQKAIDRHNSERAQKASIARHSQPGGNRDKQQKVRKAWASGKYRARDQCAEEISFAIGCSFSTARKALRGTPNPENWVKIN
ncbi:hypothetical protein [Larsenimonas suaedae]|uniref:Uncharacterized protein n=1 Tax=Larsenimonas suaedae TaxID=1851019 RepID=A0ABU1GYF0_9GAMM|nr:hypothetical protein [Larsenimonas suaedae]MCM2972895.1 hypothetical protein [Larsenimonas suaedae]MDR5896994.1 hypothetical protein [Larsenimonas suaedae]